MNKQEHECRCRMLRTLSQKSEAAIKFDPDLREYHIGDGQSQWVVNFCPFCGDEIKASTRAELFPVIDDHEVKALSDRLKKCKSVVEVVDEVGPPDDEIVVHEDTNSGGDQGKEVKHLKYDSLLRGGRVFIMTEGESVVGISFQPRLLDDGSG